MDHFQIFDTDHPAPAAPTSSFHYDEGNWLYRGTGNIKVFAFEDEGDDVQVYVAIKARYEIIEEPTTKYSLSPLLSFAV